MQYRIHASTFYITNKHAYIHEFKVKYTIHFADGQITFIRYIHSQPNTLYSTKVRWFASQKTFLVVKT